MHTSCLPKLGALQLRWLDLGCTLDRGQTLNSKTTLGTWFAKLYKQNPNVTDNGCGEVSRFELKTCFYIKFFNVFHYVLDKAYCLVITSIHLKMYSMT